MSIIEGNPFEKGLSLELPSENFQYKIKTNRINPIGINFILKVFGRGFGRKPFFRKVSPDKYL